MIEKSLYIRYHPSSPFRIPYTKNIMSGDLDIIEEKNFQQDKCFNITSIFTQMVCILDFGLVALVLEYKDGSFIVYLTLENMGLEKWVSKAKKFRLSSYGWFGNLP